MRLDKIDLNLFVVFEAIYRERSITQVATALNLTQPAVSNALARLRQSLDDPLFVRTPQGMYPTPVADNLIGDVRAALGLLERGVGATARFDPLRSEKVFNLAMNDLGEALLLPQLQQQLQQLAPLTSLTSYYVSRDKATEELKAGVIDLLLDVPAVNARELQFAPVAALDYVVAMRPGHPLTAKRRLGLKEYLACDHLHVSSRRRGRGQVDIALHTLGEHRRVALRVANYLVAERVTAQSDLLWTLPATLTRQLKLEVRKVPFTIEPLVWNLYWHKSTADDPANSWLRELLLGVAGQVLSKRRQAAN